MKSSILVPSRSVWVCAVLALGVVLCTDATAGVSPNSKHKKSKRAAIAGAATASKERVVVTGSLIPQVVTEKKEQVGASPVYVITREQINRLGVTSVSAALRRTGFGR